MNTACFKNSILASSMAKFSWNAVATVVTWAFIAFAAITAVGYIASVWIKAHT